MQDAHFTGDDRIAIIGADIRAPGAPDTDAFLDLILDGREAHQEVAGPELHDAGFITRRPVLPDVDLFDPDHFRISMADAVRLDPQHRHFLMLCRSLLHKAAIDPKTVPNIGVIASCDENQYQQTILAQAAGADTAAVFSDYVSSEKDFVATRVSYLLGLTGPAYTVQTACSSSLVAVHQAVMSLRAGECDACIAGGVAIQFPQAAPIQHVPGMIYSRDGSCRPFDEEADGTNLASGVAAVLLCRYQDAVQRGDKIISVIRGSAINNDGNRKMSYTSPSPTGQQRAIEAALAPVSQTMDKVAFVETHGTATKLGDPIEFRSLSKAFQTLGAPKDACALTGVKANFGHLSCAAGVAGLIKAALCLEARVIPRMTNFRSASPMLRMTGSPFRVLTENETLGEGAFHALVTSFGIGGTNAAVVLETPPRTSSEPVPEKAAAVFVPLSDDNPAALARNMASLSKVADLSACAWAGQRLSKSGAYRGFVLASQDGERHAFAAPLPANPEPDLCLVFPGQGAFPLGRIRELYSAHVGFQRAFDDTVTSFPKPWQTRLSEEVTGRTEGQFASQPIQFAAQIALFSLLKQQGVHASSIMGHSLGEFAAFVASDMLSLEHAARLVAARHDAMAESAPGAMLVVGNAKAEYVATAVASGCTIAAINGGGQISLSGSEAEIDAFLDHMEQNCVGADVLLHRLDLPIAFHNPALRPHLAPLVEAAHDTRLGNPLVDVISTLTGDVLNTDMDLAQYLLDQAVSAVRFSQATECALARGTGHFLEVGASRLTKWTEARGTQTIPLLDPLNADVLTSLHLGLGRLWAAGLNVPFPVESVVTNGQQNLLPNYVFDLVKCWPESIPQKASVDVDGAASTTLATPPAEQPKADSGTVRQLFARHLTQNDIDPESTFSELGLHSMIAISLCADIHQETGIQIEMAEFMNLGTVGRVEARISEAQAAA